MIRLNNSYSADQAKAYYTDALAKSDYYISDQEVAGQFKGRLAERLGLSGAVTREAFFSLCENRTPVTQEPLTPITKAGRITGYDINFHCPKSLSVIAALSNDDHILEAFEKSVHETMRDIEADAKTRVRKDGRYDDRVTGEIIYGSFIHYTARPVDGCLPDPHLHAHCYVFNCTYDDQEKKIKALKTRAIHLNLPYYQARFHKRLSDKLIELGYQVRPTAHAFEIIGVPEQVIKHFSKRTDAIGRVAKEKGITDAKALAELGALTRGKKQKGLSMAELKAEWRRQIADLRKGQGKDDDRPIRFAPDRQIVPLTREDCIHHAILHCFERASVMSERRLLEVACKYAMGQARVSLDDLQFALARDIRIIRIEHYGQAFCTTREVLQEEKRMVKLAQQGIGKMEPLYPHIADVDKNNQQHLAIAEILTTTNQVSIIRGAAGTGKTWLMKKSIDMMEDAGKKVTVVAPTAKAARGILREDFKDAETVARLLADEKMQERLEDQVLWVDEAGLLGTRDCLALLELATEKNCRIVFAGDTRQHASIVRGDALRILNTVGNIATAELNVIRRQQNEMYKAAVQDLADGHIAPAFEKLDAMGAIKTIDPADPHAELVNRYVDTIRAGKSALIVSPTHAEGERVTAGLREKLKQTALIDKKDVNRIRYVNRNLTEAEKMDARNFEPGQAVQFSQHVHTMKRGSIWMVDKVEGLDVHLTNDTGETNTLPLDRAKHYDIFTKTEISVAKHDKVRITRNTYDKKGKRLDNGTTLEVLSIGESGNIRLRNPKGKAVYVLDSDFGHLTHDYCVTSHASQGQTVDEVFISQPASTFGATNANQFYVSVSRGREAVHIFTDDREALLENAQELGDRQSALELMADKKLTPQDYILQKQRSDCPKEITKEPERKNDHTLTINKIELDYEPGL